MLPVLTIAVLSLAISVFACWKFGTRELVAVLALVIPLPFYFGIWGAIGDGQSLRASLEIILLSGTSPTTKEIASGAYFAVLTILVGLVASLPVYLVGVAGLCVRALLHRHAEPNTMQE